MVEGANLVSDQTCCKLVRESYLAERVMFVGGYSGSGKSMMTSIMGTFARVEIQKYNYALEHVCELHFLGRIADDVASATIRLHTDLDLYNMMISRETNFRFSDMSSVFKNPGAWRYIRRLFQPGDRAVVSRIEKEKPILQILKHDLLVHSLPLFKALGERLRILEVVRHPLYMIQPRYYYIDRYGTDVRDFSICFDYKGHPLPYFVRGWEDQYIRSNSMDKVIYSLAHLSQRSEEVIQSLSGEEKNQILILPFEPYVLSPWDYMKQLEALLGTHMTGRTRRELRRQKVPRKMIADGIDAPIYRRYGWRPSEKGANEANEREQRRKFAADHATPEAMKILDQLCAKYEEKYLRGL